MYSKSSIFIINYLKLWGYLERFEGEKIENMLLNNVLKSY